MKLHVLGHLQQEKKLTFPDKSSWNPTVRSLSPTERLLLLGPMNDVLYYQSFCVRDPNTNRCVTYGIHQPGIAQAKNSFVFLKETCDSGRIPQFGLIVSLFTHTFAEITYWALLDLFLKANYDTDSKMWYVTNGTSCKTAIFPLDSLFPPLVVAQECEHLWFLNYIQHCNQLMVTA